MQLCPRCFTTGIRRREQNGACFGCISFVAVRCTRLNLSFISSSVAICTHVNAFTHMLGSNSLQAACIYTTLRHASLTKCFLRFAFSHTAFILKSLLDQVLSYCFSPSLGRHVVCACTQCKFGKQSRRPQTRVWYTEMRAFPKYLLSFCMPVSASAAPQQQVC